MGPWNISQPDENKGFIKAAFDGISQIIERHPNGVAQLLRKHGIDAPPTRLHVGRAAKVKKDFFTDLLQRVKAGGFGNDDSDFTGYSNLVGDRDRFAVAEKLTTADKLANAGTVFSNIIRATQHPAEPYNQRIPSYYEPSGKYGVVAWDRDELKSDRWFGMDKKFVYAIAILIGIAILYELKKRG
ncbi:hypothetical protein HQ865_01205 [Mucilaginibacter mali]|uniref:Uncharacterized protein n=1 Tax=Mucilaginibacter mali TaxID=2740462 RepID=A0A7D4QCW0_9SPHI|nr:hypothetical protein [Mucilaginibacter mali]QKJ28432.1 hypothetical protein HQ865_01205 [Mucilaginibacter mali]